MLRRPPPEPRRLASSFATPRQPHNDTPGLEMTSQPSEDVRPRIRPSFREHGGRRRVTPVSAKIAEFEGSQRREAARCFDGCRFFDRLALCASVFFNGRSATGTSSGFPAMGEGFASRPLGARAGADGAGAGADGARAGADGVAGTERAGGFAELVGSLGPEVTADRHTADCGPTSALRANAAVNPIANPMTFRQRSRGTGASSIVGCLLRIAIGPVVFRIVDMSPTSENAAMASRQSVPPLLVIGRVVTRHESDVWVAVVPGPPPKGLKRQVEPRSSVVPGGWASAYWVEGGHR
jgi:hypothetical protein